MKKKNLIDFDSTLFSKVVPVSGKLEGIEGIYQILKAQKNLNLLFNTDDKAKLINQRPATEIIKSGFTTGCDDDAVVFTALAKFFGYKPKFMEVVEIRWLESPMEERMMRGHAFVLVPIDKEYILVEPQRKTVYIDYEWVLRSYVLLGIGDSPYDCGLYDMASFNKVYMELKREYKSSAQKLLDRWKELSDYI